MQPATHDFTVRRGDTERCGVLLSRRSPISGQVTRFDLAGATIALKIERKSGAIEKTLGSGLTLDLATAALRWTLSPAETAGFGAGETAPYTLKVTDAGGVVMTFLTGHFAAKG